MKTITEKFLNRHTFAHFPAWKRSVVAHRISCASLIRANHVQVLRDLATATQDRGETKSKDEEKAPARRSSEAKAANRNTREY
jgi:hypothetical protein